MGNGLFISYLHSPTSFLPRTLLFIRQTIRKALGGGGVVWGGGTSTHTKLIQGENNQRNNGHVNKKIHTAQKLPDPRHNFSN